MSKSNRVVDRRPAGVRLKPSPGLSEVVRRLRGDGRAAFAVGGGVRDGLLGLPVAEWDVATDARPERVLVLFERTFPIGLEHGQHTAHAVRGGAVQQDGSGRVALSGRLVSRLRGPALCAAGRTGGAPREHRVAHLPAGP